MENIGALQESLTVGSNQQTLKARLQSIPKKHCLNSFHPFPTPQSHQQSNNHDVDNRANGEKENYCTVDVRNCLLSVIIDTQCQRHGTASTLL